jgi:hypothetical protein
MQFLSILGIFIKNLYDRQMYEDFSLLEKGGGFSAFDYSAIFNKSFIACSVA